MDDSRFIQQTLDDIEKRIAQALSVRDLASRAAFSQSHYQRLFHTAVGDSIMEYVKKRRLTLAGQDLCSTAATVLEIALKYGYQSHEGFSRAFKAYHGVTPSQCRRYAVFTRCQRKQARLIKERGICMAIPAKAAKAAEEMMNILNGFVVKAKETAERTEKAYQEDPTIRFLHIFAEETNMLADKTQTACSRIQSLTETDPVSAYNKRAEILKVIDSQAMQMNIIALNAGLQAARTDGEGRRRVTKGIADSYQELSGMIGRKATQAGALLQEMAAIIMEDFHRELESKWKELAGRSYQIRDEAGILAQFLIETAEKGISASSSLAVIGEEVHYAYGSFKDSCSQLEKDLSGRRDSYEDIRDLMAALEEHLQRMEGISVRLRILASAARMDELRTVDTAEWKEASRRIMEMADHIEEALSASGEVFHECRELLRVFTEKPKAAVEPWIQGAAFQGNILCFYTKTELAKMKHVMQENQIERYESVLSCMMGIQSRLVKLIGTGDSSGVMSIGKKMENLAGDMDGLGGIPMDLPDNPWRFLANLYRGLAQSIQRAAE